MSETKKDFHFSYAEIVKMLDSIESEIKRAEAVAVVATIAKEKAHNDDFYKSKDYRCIKPTKDGKGFEVDALAILKKERNLLMECLIEPKK